MTKIIAEIGSNWRNLDDCLMSIEKAKQCGADAVKFQLYTHKELYGVDGTTAGELPREWVPKLKECADRYNIEFMCTAFSPEGLRFVDPFVDCHKIASAEMRYNDLIDAALDSGKSMYVSTGGHDEHDIMDTVVRPGKMGHEDNPITLMYCVSRYPATTVDLRCIDMLRYKFDLPVGYSDHTLDYITIPFIAANHHQAVAIEKHVTFIDADTPDRCVSLNERQFAHMCNLFQLGPLMPLPEEQEFIERHKRRHLKHGFYRPVSDSLITSDNL